MKEERFKIEMVKGVPLVYMYGNLLLLDTGARCSFGEIYNRLWGKVKNPVIRGPVSVRKIASNIGAPLMSGIIGNDLLKGYNISLNLKKEELLISIEDLNPEGIELPVRFFHDVPYLRMVVDKKPLNAFFDTGATYFYLPPELAEKGAREEKDWAPLVGHWVTRIFNKIIYLGGQPIKIEAGCFPKNKAGGILGEQDNISAVISVGQLLHHYEVCFFFKCKRKRIVLKPLEKENRR